MDNRNLLNGAKDPSNFPDVPIVGSSPTFAWHYQLNGKNYFVVAKTLAEGADILRRQEIHPLALAQAGEVVV